MTDPLYLISFQILTSVAVQISVTRMQIAQTFLVVIPVAVRLGTQAMDLPAQVKYTTYCSILNPLPDDNILDWSKLKQITDDILKWI